MKTIALVGIVLCMTLFGCAATKPMAEQQPAVISRASFIAHSQEVPAAATEQIEVAEQQRSAGSSYQPFANRSHAIRQSRLRAQEKIIQSINGE